MIVSLDKSGNATGNLSEDAGDGYQYQKGEYLVFGFTARQVGSVVKVEIKTKEGKLKAGNRENKINVLAEKGLIESEWIVNNKGIIKMRVR